MVVIRPLSLRVAFSKCPSKDVHVFAIKSYRLIRGIVILILNLCTSWVWVVNFTPPDAFSPLQDLRYPLNRSLCGVPDLKLKYWGRKNIFLLAELEPNVVQPVA